MDKGESSLAKAYRKLYEALCGRHPKHWPWHFQWLDAFYLHRRLRQLLPSLGGRVIDVGCGEKPYRDWFGLTFDYVGLDISPGPAVDVLVSPNEHWPFADDYFDTLLSSQVLEHVADTRITVNEMMRVLKPGGVAVLSFPFLYNEHGSPWDFRRLTVHGAKQLFPEVEIIHLEKHGGIGSTIAILFLNWLEISMNRTFLSRLCKALLLPVWMLVSLAVNLLGLLMDRLDRTGSFYNNVLFVIRKSAKS